MPVDMKIKLIFAFFLVVTLSACVSSRQSRVIDLPEPLKLGEGSCSEGDCVDGRGKLTFQVIFVMVSTTEVERQPLAMEPLAPVKPTLIVLMAMASLLLKMVPSIRVFS